MTPSGFRAWAELSRAVLQQHQARLARAWCALRMADGQGKGWLWRDEAEEVLLRSCELHEKGVTRLLEAGEGVFWRHGLYGKLVLTSQIKLADLFGVALGFAVQLPPDCLVSLRKFKAYLFMSWFARKPRTISLQAMSALFSVSKPTLRSWAKLAGLKREPQFAFAREPKNAPIMQRDDGVFVTDVDRDGQLEICWQLPNRYSAPKLQAFKKRQSGGGSAYRQRAYRRMYFENAKALSRAMRGAQHGEWWYLFAKPHRFLGRGYELVTI